MRVLILDTAYEGFLDRHYGARPELASTSYDAQWRALMDAFFGTADAYSHFLAAAGQSAHEVVVNCEPLQRAWEQEHLSAARRLSRRLGSRDLAVEQAEWFQADVIYVQNMNVTSPKTLEMLKRGRLLVGQIASELPPSERLTPYDLILTSLPHYVEQLRQRGLESEYLRLAFDPRVLDRLERGEARHGAVFVGGLRRTQHQRGNELLARAAERAPIDFYGYGADDWPADAAIRRRYGGEAWGLEMYRVLSRSAIALNRHIDVAGDFANNMRLYEATGIGTLLLTDAKRNLSELFEPGREVVTYADENELVERLLYYLEHDGERETIAREGQQRTLREHSYGPRMRELADILTGRLG